MLDSPYSFSYLGRKETGRRDHTHFAHYSFRGKERKFLVTLDTHNFGVVEFRYCATKDKESRSAYSKIYNDNDGIRIISTCFNIIFDYWRRFPDSSFWFYAMPRNIPVGLDLKNRSPEGYLSARFKIYSYFVENVFSPDDFTFAYDSRALIYILINKKKDTLSVLTEFSNFLLSNHSKIFDPE